MNRLIMWHLLVVLLCCDYVLSDEKIHKLGDVTSAKIHERSMKSLEYDVDTDNGLPMVSRDLMLLAATIDSIDDDNCRDHARLIVDGIQNLTTWAVKYYDASGKFPEGVLGGSIYQLGNFDECMDIGRNDDAPQGIAGKYCLGDVDIDVPEDYLIKEGTIWEKFRKTSNRYDESIKQLHWGICVPASCSARDIQGVIRRVLDVAFSGSRLTLEPIVNDKRCYSRKPLETDSTDVIYVAIILGITLIITMGTLFHAIHIKYNKDTKGTLPQVLIAFSLISNMKKLCGPANDDGLNLDCISGIKFLAMVFIVAGHCLVFVVGGPVLNSNFWTEAITKIENSIFLNNPLLVDTFLLLSGFLFSRILLRELDKRRSVNFLFLYIFRYIRLTPAYLVVVGLYVTWLPRLDSGPLWWRMIEEKERCKASWWTNILYINNYVNTDQLCMFQSWYLSVDTQLFILAPVIIYPLWRWRKPGEFILATATLASIIVPFSMTLVNHLDPTLMIYTEEIRDISTNEYFRNSYIKTHMRASAYCFGLLYGYILYRIQTADYKLTKNCVRICWIFASLSLIMSMCSIGIFYGPRKDYGILEAAVYSSMHRALWSLGTGWLLIACITDNSGPIKSFLKWRPFVPLSRLTYSAYLVNGLVELHSISTTRTPQHLDNLSLLAKVASHLVLTFIGAVILSTMFEAPILGLEKIFLRPKMKKTERSNSTSRNSSEETITTDA